MKLQSYANFVVFLRKYVILFVDKGETMGILEKAKRAFNNFYGGSDEEPEDDEDESLEQDERDDESNGSELNNGEDNNEELNNHEDDNDELNNHEDDNKKNSREEKNGGERTEEDPNDSKLNADGKPEKPSLIGSARKKLSRAQMALMKKEAITHGCSHRLEKVPCPVCHQRSIYKSRREGDLFVKVIFAIGGVSPFDRYYCFNKKCPKSWYMNYVFNCASPQFSPVAAPTKRQFNSI